MSDRPLAPGDVIAGKYLVESILGEGGMGVVLGARNIKLDEPVAIKVLKPEAASDADAVARFFREARAAVRMKGAHVAKVLDVGTLDDGTPYMLMERLEGADLSTVIERGELMAVETAIDYVLQTCEALAEAHALGIVHRDIKPSNLFLTTGVDGSPCIKVLDFGISKATSAIDATRPDFGLTQTQTVMGSPQYMAPEQMRSSRRVDARTDIWGLGTILHELLTGAPPFVASSMPELFAMILQDPAPHVRAQRGDVPADVDAIVLRCLEKAPDARPATVHQLAGLLAPFASALSAGVAERVARVGRTTAVTTDRNIALMERARDSSPDLVRPGTGTLVSAGAPAAHASSSPAVAPSAPELAHAHTMPVGAASLSAGARRSNRSTVVAVVAVIATLVIGGSTAAAVMIGRKSSQAANHDGGVTNATSSNEVPADLLPPAIDPAPPPTWREPSAEPSAAIAAPPDSVVGALGAASSGPRAGTSPAKHAGSKGPGHVSPGASAVQPAVSAVRSAVPVQPATTASSRYD